MAYELIAFDMDGTLLDSRKRILPSSVKAIDEAISTGKHVAIASGRCPRMVFMYRDDLPRVGHAVCSAGAAIVDLHEQKVLQEVDIPHSALEKVIAASHDMDKLIETTCGTEFYMPIEETKHAERYHVGVYQPLYQNIGYAVDDIEAFTLDPANRIPKLNIHYTCTEDRDRAIASLAGENVNVVLCEAASIEVTHKSVTKGTGLAMLARELGVAPEEVIAVGDADNDLPMLREAGLAVAMGNANANARALADVTVADNDHDGCAEAIHRFLLANG